VVVVTVVVRPKIRTMAATFRTRDGFLEQGRDGDCVRRVAAT
jgi:hypothetical protein